jgi:hypothetical protein
MRIRNPYPGPHKKGILISYMLVYWSETLQGSILSLYASIVRVLAAIHDYILSLESS